MKVAGARSHTKGWKWEEMVACGDNFPGYCIHIGWSLPSLSIPIVDLAMAVEALRYIAIFSAGRSVVYGSV